MTTLAHLPYHTHNGGGRYEDIGAKVAFVARIPDPNQISRAFGLDDVEPSPPPATYNLQNMNAFIAPGVAPGHLGAESGTIYYKRSDRHKVQLWGQHLPKLKIGVIRLHTCNEGDPNTELIGDLMLIAAHLNNNYGMKPIRSLRNIIQPHYETLSLNEQQVLKAIGRR